MAANDPLDAIYLSTTPHDQGEHTWKTMPEEMMGVIPSSIRVPRLLASIIRSQYRGSEVSEETMPYRGI